MLSKLRYNNICKKIISILNTTSETFEKEIKNNTKSFIYNSKITINDLLLYRFNYVEKGFTFARVLSKINNDKLNNNDGEIFQLKIIKYHLLFIKIYIIIYLMVWPSYLNSAIKLLLSMVLTLILILIIMVM